MRHLSYISFEIPVFCSFASKTLATGPGRPGRPGGGAVAGGSAAAAPAAAPARPTTLVSELTPEEVENCAGHPAGNQKTARDDLG